MHIVALPTLLCASGISHNVCIPTLKRSLGRRAAFAQWTTPRYTRIARRSISEGDGSHTADSHEDEGPVFAPLDQDDVGGLGGTSEDLFGPLAVLLVGFSHYEVDVFRKFMLDMEADMVKVLTCTKHMVSSTLEEALNAPAEPYEQLPLGTKRLVFLSGMSAAEVQEVISAYSDSGLPRTVWAAAVPGNHQKRISALLEDIYGDHQLMAERAARVQSLREQGGAAL